MKFKPTAISLVNMGTAVLLNFAVPLVYGKDLEKIVNKFKAGNEYEFKQIRQKRSLNANAYFWKLADEIAQELYTTSEQIYWEIIQRVGKFDTYQCESLEAMNRFKSVWQSKGLGWLTRTMDEEKFIVRAYYGSSSYNTKEMSRLIDEVVSEAKSLGIETLTPEELSRMMENYE